MQTATNRTEWLEHLSLDEMQKILALVDKDIVDIRVSPEYFHYLAAKGKSTKVFNPFMPLFTGMPAYNRLVISQDEKSTNNQWYAIDGYGDIVEKGEF